MYPIPFPPTATIWLLHLVSARVYMRVGVSLQMLHVFGRRRVARPPPLVERGVCFVPPPHVHASDTHCGCHVMSWCSQHARDGNQQRACRADGRAACLACHACARAATATVKEFKLVKRGSGARDATAALPRHLSVVLNTTQMNGRSESVCWRHACAPVRGVVGGAARATLRPGARIRVCVHGRSACAGSDGEAQLQAEAHVHQEDGHDGRAEVRMLRVCVCVCVRFVCLCVRLFVCVCCLDVRRPCGGLHAACVQRVRSVSVRRTMHHSARRCARGHVQRTHATHACAQTHARPHARAAVRSDWFDS